MQAPEIGDSSTTELIELQDKYFWEEDKNYDFYGKTTLRTKIMLADKCIEQVSHFRYLGCNIISDVDHDGEIINWPSFIQNVEQFVKHCQGKRHD